MNAIKMLALPTSGVTTPEGNDATNQCGTALSFSAPVFADSCSSLSVVSNFVASGSSCRQTNTATWTATDACGNSASGRQTIILVDTTGMGRTSGKGEVWIPEVAGSFRKKEVVRSA